jgi:anti-sigma factor RsiW
VTNPHPAQPPAPDSSITCREVLDFVMAYLDGELPSGQKHAFERHLAVCPSCVNYLETYRTTVRLGKSLGHDPNEPATGNVPEGLIKAIREARLKMV